VGVERKEEKICFETYVDMLAHFENEGLTAFVNHKSMYVNVLIVLLSSFCVRIKGIWCSELSSGIYCRVK
jgi:hypothetical protein